MLTAEAFELSVNLIETFLVTWFYATYLGSKYSGKRKVLSFLTMWGAGFTEICIINNITFFESVATVIAIGMYFAFSLLFLKGPILLKLWISVISHIVVALAAIVPNVAICYIIDYSPVDMITVFNSVRVISVIITKIVLLIAYAIILRAKKNNPIKSCVWYMLIILPIISVFCVCWLMEVALVHRDVMGHILFGMICSVASNIIIYYLYIVINKEHSSKTRVEYLELQNENSRQQILSGDAFVKQMKALRHDLVNHLLTIGALLERGMVEKSKKYIKEMCEERIPSVYYIVETNNEAFDAIVNAKLAICARDKVFMEVKVKDGRVDIADDMDISILFGNLIDNAIEAARNTESGHVCVEVERKKNCISVLVSNTIKESVLDKNKKLITVKSDKKIHGIGLRNVHDVVEKYNGIIDFYEESGEFRVHVLLQIN